ncbi:uncharacterized protein BDR25DRAFT_353123 [Lindgomyces ingoldianus]|uniref:Uncharacterized protein n=1 Tax=Lindgomyces ingoldianus TaxID=673940 RepID=A0ACB6R129_9PLEO|nr:uncharacterized protein BDR25DRAFT_353123 [Lindgomyces ingoldianus]KAF2472800.1 hypothetical protein BDR25DRAFT_353123 [Lindgomyces ingoldianus]
MVLVWYQIFAVAISVPNLSMAARSPPPCGPKTGILCHEPQPIGIDIGMDYMCVFRIFSRTHTHSVRHAVYARDALNFTLIGRVQTGSELLAHMVIMLNNRDAKQKYFEEHGEIRRQQAIDAFAKELRRVKEMAFQDHNITINSAVIARPHWMFNEYGWLLDDAVTQAEIEWRESGEARGNFAILTVPPEKKGRALVLEHSHWQFTIREYDLDRHSETWSMDGDFLHNLSGQSAVSRIFSILRDKVQSSSGQVKGNPEARDIDLMAWKIMVARQEILRILCHNPNAPIQRMIDLSAVFTEETRVSLTASDVKLVEHTMIEEFVGVLEGCVTKQDLVWDYYEGKNLLFQSSSHSKKGYAAQPYFNALEFEASHYIERKTVLDEFRHSTLPPWPVKSWYKPFSKIIIIGCSQDIPRIEAALNRLSPLLLPQEAVRQLFPPCEVVARGAAVKALRFIEMDAKLKRASETADWSDPELRKLLEARIPSGYW